MSLTKPNRIINPDQQPDAHVDRQHGVITRRDLKRDQESAARRQVSPGIAIGNGSVIVAENVRVIHFVGAGVTIQVTGDVATITIP